MSIYVRTVNHARPALASFDLETHQELANLRREDVSGYLSKLRSCGHTAAKELLALVPSELSSVDEVLEAATSLSNQFKPAYRPYLELGITEGLTEVDGV